MLRAIERDLYVSRIDGSRADERALTAVYVVGNEHAGAVKIGIAIDVQKRMASLQTGSPHPLRLHSALYTGRRQARHLEKLVHDKLKECEVHLNGEWFDVDPVDAAAVLKKVADISGIAVLSPWDYAMIAGSSDGAIRHETFSLSETCRQLLADNVVAPFGMRG